MLPALDLAGVVRITRLINHSERPLAVAASRQLYNATILLVGIGGRTATECEKRSPCKLFGHGNLGVTWQLYFLMP